MSEGGVASARVGGEKLPEVPQFATEGAGLVSVGRVQGVLESVTAVQEDSQGVVATVGGEEVAEALDLPAIFRGYNLHSSLFRTAFLVNSLQNHPLCRTIPALRCYDRKRTWGAATSALAPPSWRLPTSTIRKASLRSGLRTWTSR